MKCVSEGLIVAIPLVDGSGWRPAKILFCSKRYNNVILIGLAHAYTNDLDLKYVWETDDFNWKRIYTGAQCVRAGYWPVIGETPVLDSEQRASLRIVGGEVWLRDDELRPATDADRLSLPKMEVAGRLLVEKWAQ